MHTANDQVLIAVKELHDFVAQQMADLVVRGDKDFVRVFLTDSVTPENQPDAALMQIAELNPTLLEPGLFCDERGLSLFFDTMLRPESTFRAQLAQKLGHPASIVIVARELLDKAQGPVSSRVAIDIRGQNFAVSTTHAIKGTEGWREMSISPFPLEVPVYLSTGAVSASQAAHVGGRGTRRQLH